MPTPFICQKCTARLVIQASRFFRPNNCQFFTQVIPTERPLHDAIAPLARHSRGPEPDLAQLKHPHEVAEEDRDIFSATSLPFLTSPEEQDGETGETTVHPNVVVWKYTPRRRPSVRRLARLLPTKNVRDLKAKILGALGEYKLVHRDLMVLYGLSRPEARHAVSQLERLLWGHLEIETAASRLDQYLVWKKEISAILSTPAAVSSIQKTDSSINDTSSETASHESDAASIRTAWQRLNKDRRERLWPQMILSALELEPHRLPAFIQSTFDPSWCPSYIVEDVLYVLLHRHKSAVQKRTGKNSSQIQQYIEAIAAFVLEKSPPRYLALEQTVLHLIFSPLPTAELIQYYELLRTIEHPLHANTLLHLASRFAKSSDTKAYATDILRSLTDMKGFDINTPSAASVCTSLLTLNENESLPDEQAAPDVLFELLLKLDSRPNLLVLTALMRNFCIRGHLDTAWKIFDLMLHYGLEPDQHVYSILLNGSKHNPDSIFLEQIFSVITSRNAWSPALVNDFLDILFRENESQVEKRRRQRKKANNAWRPMLQLYAKFYDLAPLQKLTLFPLENLLDSWSIKPQSSTLSTRMAESLMPRPDSQLMQPDSIALCLMLGAHMRSLLTPKYAIHYYNHFFELVEKKDPTALSLLAERGTLVYDIFIRTLMQFRNTTRFAIEQVQKMVRDADEEKARYGHSLYHHLPSVHTWTIILNGLKNHHDTRGVVGVHSMMSRIGHVQPTLPTWNALIQTLARAGSVRGVVKAIWSLEQAGFHPNDRTIKAVSMLSRPLREQAIAQLEEMRKAPERYLKANARPQDLITGLRETEETHNAWSDNPIRRPLGIPRNLEELKRQQVNSNLPVHLVREGLAPWSVKNRVPVTAASAQRLKKWNSGTACTPAYTQ